jgi:hypothetical protein
MLPVLDTPMTHTDDAAAVRRLAPLALAVLGVLFWPQLASADTITLQWDLNSEPEVTGYFLYVGTQSGVYSQTIDVQNTNTYAFASAVPGQRYYFAVAAHAGSAVSPLSNEVSGISNSYPVLTNPGNQTGHVGQAVSLTLVATEPDGTALTYSASGLPPGLFVSASTGLIAGTPTTAGTFNVTATVSDGVLSAQQTFSWVIQSTTQNRPPTLVNPGSRSSTVAQQILLQLQGADPDGDTLSYSASGLPAGLQIASVTGNITGTLTTVGTFSVTVNVSDGQASTSQSFTWTVMASNVAPTLTAIAAQGGTVGQATSLQLQGSDGNGDSLTYSASGLPPGLSITASTGLIAGTPTNAGTYAVTATVSDGTLTASRAFSWTIAAINVAPTLAVVAAQTGTVGQATSLQLQGSDANGTPLTYSTSGLPPGLSITASTGLIAGTPTTAGTYTVTATVSDGALTASRAFSWTVNAAVTTTTEPDLTVPTGAAARHASTSEAFTGTTAAVRSQRASSAPAGRPAIRKPGATSATSGSSTTTDPLAYTGSTALVRSVASSHPADGSMLSATSSVLSASGTSETGTMTMSSQAITRAVVTPVPDGTQVLSESTSGGDAAGTDESTVGSGATGERRLAVSAPVSAPTISIETPIRGAMFAGGSFVIFAGIARDAEDRDLTSQIVWTSSTDGRIGTGGLLNKQLTTGTHIITASVTDSGGHTRSAQVTIRVGP